MTEFQAHTKSFDTLSSSEITESITGIEWINNQRDQKPALLISNSRTVNLMRIVNKLDIKTESVKRKFAKGQGICIPKTKVIGESQEVKLIASFKTGKEQHLHSISMCPDRENFITSDENRVNLWNIERANAEVYSLIDYNRQKISGNDEYLTCARFNTEGLMFLYATNKGQLRLCDLRESSNFHRRPSMEFLAQRKGVVDYFDKWLNVISSASFVPGSQTVLSRDFLSAKLWDMRKGGNTSMIVDTGNAPKPIYSAQVTDYIQWNLDNLQQSESLDDRFFLEVSPDGKHMATGAYNKSAHIMDINATSNTSIVCKFDQPRNQNVGSLKVYNQKKHLVIGAPTPAVKTVELRKRVHLGAWKPNGIFESPGSHTLALAFRNCIYLYRTKKQIWIKKE